MTSEDHAETKGKTRERMERMLSKITTKDRNDYDSKMRHKRLDMLRRLTKYQVEELRKRENMRKFLARRDETEVRNQMN